MWGIVQVVYFISGLAYFVWEFEVSEFEYDLDKRSAAQKTASYFVLYYVLLIPTFTHALVVLLRLIDRGLDEFGKIFKAFTVVVIVGLLLMVVSVFLFINWVDGLICIGIMLVFIYIGVQVGLYIKNDYYMKPMF
jgi:hypothetical protein